MVGGSYFPYILLNEIPPPVLTVYLGKGEILVGKSNGMCHSVWEASENVI